MLSFRLHAWLLHAHVHCAAPETKKQQNAEGRASWAYSLDLVQFGKILKGFPATGERQVPKAGQP